MVDALDAGFDSLEHVTFMTAAGVEPPDGVLQRIVDCGVFVSLTAGALPGPTAIPAIAARLEQVLANHTWMVTHGARVVVGSDAGVGPSKPHGVLPHALVQMSRWVPLIEALQAMTSVAADAMGMSGRKGVLVKGADADLLAVQGDPSVKPDALLDVVGVWTKGERLRR